MEFFISDLKEYIGNLHQASSFALFFKEYKIIECDGKEYLAASDHIKRDRPEQYDSPTLLLAFVGLVRPPLPKWLKSSDKETMKKVIPNKRIIKFCKKFGLPYEEGEPGTYIDLEHLRYRIGILYFRFRTWYALFSGSDKEDYIKAFSERWLLPWEPKDIAKEYLPLEVSAAMNKVGVHCEYNKNTDKTILGIVAHSLIDIAYFHLANLLTMNETYIKQHLKTCNNPDCGDLFWSLHGHKKYCEFCDRRTVHARKKKEGKRNEWLY